MSLKYQKWLIFCIFCCWKQRIVTVCVKYLSAYERFYLALSENAMNYSTSFPGYLFTIRGRGKNFLKLLWGRGCELLDFELPLPKYQFLKLRRSFFYISSLNISWTVTPKPINHFLKDLNNIFQVHVDILL